MNILTSAISALNDFVYDWLVVKCHLSWTYSRTGKIICLVHLSVRKNILKIRPLSSNTRESQELFLFILFPLKLVVCLSNLFVKFKGESSVDCYRLVEMHKLSTV